MLHVVRRGDLYLNICPVLTGFRVIWVKASCSARWFDRVDEAMHMVDTVNRQQPGAIVEPINLAPRKVAKGAKS